MIDKETIRQYLEPYKKVNYNGCWIWPFNKSEKGYGLTNIDGKVYRVHRLSAFAYLGLNLDDKSQKSLHKCDNPSCWNPDHLFVGTQLDNMRDAIAKGTFVGSEPGASARRNQIYCVNRHLFTAETTYYQGPNKEHRACLICRRERDRVRVRR